MKNLNFLLISKNIDRFSVLERALARGGTHRVVSCSRTEEVYEAIAAGKVDAVIVDEEVESGSGLEFIRELIPRNPFINCALVSPLYVHEFHEATEGYGVFMQLPGYPGAEEAEKITAHLLTIC